MSRGRAANRQGSIRKIRRGTKIYYEARYTDPIQHRQRSVCATTEAEAMRKLAEIQAQITQGTYTGRTKVTVTQWAETWLAEYTSSLSEGTLKTYTDNMRLHILPAIGRAKLADIRPADYQRLMNDLKRKGLSPKSIRNIHCGVPHVKYNLILRG